METKLEILPGRTAGAAENMAADFLLLQRLAAPGVARFRHYEWRSPAFTFGYSQKIAFVRSQLPQGQSFDICRRPTGGGIVDHREDWTYTLVIPRGHPFEEARAAQSYQAVHECLAGALRAQGAEAALKTPSAAAVAASAGIAGVCFESAELHDVVSGKGGAKIAGAAQKRNKRGLLFQGSIWKPAAGPVDWEKFHDDFAAALAAALGAAAGTAPWPEMSEDELAALTEHYASPAWIEAR